MRLILSIIIVFYSSFNLLGQELKLSDIIENTDVCNIEQSIIGTKILVMNPKGYSENQLKKFRVEQMYQYKSNGDSTLFLVFQETGKSGYWEYIIDGKYTITGLKQLTDKSVNGYKIVTDFDCQYNDYGKLTQLNDTIYTYLTALQWNEYKSYILESHNSQLAKKLVGQTFTANTKTYKVAAIESGKDGIYAISGNEKIRLTPADIEQCLAGSCHQTMATAIDNKKKIDGLIDIFEKHAETYSQLHQAFNRGQKDATTYQKFQAEKLKAHEALDKIKISYKTDQQKWTFNQMERWIKLNDKFDLARIGLLFSLE
jgi:hypothetical protein